MTSQPMTPQTATPDNITPFGTLITPGIDGTPFGPADATFDLAQGTPRLYIMRLPARPLLVKGITRHSRVTQCLAATGGRDWFICLAPPSPDAEAPDPATIRCFRITGDVALALHIGTWHAGPYFEGDSCDFLNLELTNTNETDHHTAPLPIPIAITP